MSTEYKIVKVQLTKEEIINWLQTKSEEDILNEIGCAIKRNAADGYYTTRRCVDGGLEDIENIISGWLLDNYNVYELFGCELEEMDDGELVHFDIDNERYTIFGEACCVGELVSNELACQLYEEGRVKRENELERAVAVDIWEYINGATQIEDYDFYFQKTAKKYDLKTSECAGCVNGLIRGYPRTHGLGALWFTALMELKNAWEWFMEDYWHNMEKDLEGDMNKAIEKVKGKLGWMKETYNL